ncbi:hydantoinase/oxoprolinase family protein [Methylophaga sp. OBS4]|uniref:hydantoinase/oxoprolinase family protein n=1 Tax=Methylophaga sp. OBS4 TaxID=2991935 RepID=UPI00225562B1|nr:hydantoinase/oxoprolinase family protein [Methylophaga sp. OBS4]MCX4186383.1 H4MPT-linked C1 transfer pathway protein [Methylophaga sp. OBS4]
MNKSQPSGFSGWDIGGAHLKVARCDVSGQLQDIIQFPCALWRGIDELETAFSLALAQLNNQTDVHAITMTGELVDFFRNRQQGVEQILDCIVNILPLSSIQIFTGKQGWLEVEQAKTQWQAVASMNWQASAMYAAATIEQGLFIDIGSTTCDIIPIVQHQIRPGGLSDHDRQRHGELVYTGAIRTPLMAIAHQAPLNGDWIPLTAEWFASSADVWCLLNQLSSADIQDNSADGQPWDKPYCRQRLARILATDAEFASEQQWSYLAQWFAEKQLQTITEACLQVLSSAPEIAQQSPLIGAGVGRFMVQLIAKRLNRPYIDFAELCNGINEAAAHAPAAALALLAQQQLS